MTQEQITLLKELAVKHRHCAIHWREMAEAFSEIPREEYRYKEKASYADRQAEALETAITRLESEVEG